MSLALLLALFPAPDDGVWVAVGYGGRRMISKDGVVWEISAEWAQPGGDDANNLMGLVFAKGRFVAVGGGGGGPTGGGHILVSSDGREWREVKTMKNRVNPVVFGDDRFVVGGPGRRLWWSPDAETWTEGALLEAKEATHFRHGAFGNGVFVFVGNHGGSGGVYWCATSADGEKVSGLRTDLPEVRALAFGNGRFVLVGPGGVRMSSKDGKVWERHPAEGADQTWVIWTGASFLAGGGKTTSTSPDGAAWTDIPDRIPCTPKWTDGTRFVGTSWPGQMWSSEDGKAWTKGAAMTANGINKVVFGIPERR